jgi:PIN domain nuclease of toxin-antitoxin system
MIILDTCVFIWLIDQQENLSEAACKAVRTHPDALYCSSISLFEMALKQKKGKLMLPLPALECFEKAMELHGVKEVPVDSKVCAQAVNLPAIHRDPCDRFIIATAIVHDMHIVTADTTIAQYNVPVIW